MSSNAHFDERFSPVQLTGLFYMLCMSRLEKNRVEIAAICSELALIQCWPLKN